MPPTHPVRPARPTLLLGLVLVLLVALLAGCGGSSDGASAPSTTDRAAETDEVGAGSGAGWDVEFHVVLTNRMTVPVQVGALSEPGSMGEVMVSSTPDDRKPAGDSTVFTIPAGNGSDAGELDILVQMKSGQKSEIDNRNSTPRDALPPQDVMIVLPTSQLWVEAAYSWQSFDCTKDPDLGDFCNWKRTAQVNWKTHEAHGFNLPMAQLPCLDPTQFGGDLPTKAYQGQAQPSGFQKITVDFRAGEEMPNNCGGDHVTVANLDLTGMSLAASGTEGTTTTTTKPNTGHSLKLAGTTFQSAQLPAADLSGLDLSETTWTGTYANLAYANLRGANLTRATLVGADLTGADLTGATITGANFNDAILFGVDLSKANGIPADSTDALLCRTTPPKKGPLAGSNPNKDCDQSIPLAVPKAGANGLLPLLEQDAPLIFSSASGSFDCARDSSVGPHELLRLPYAQCGSGATSTYGSASVGTDGKGGSVTVDANGVRSSAGGLVGSPPAAGQPGGFMGYVCLASQASGKTCPLTFSH